MPRLIVFDLDGTIIDERKFYQQVYSGSLDQLIEDLHGDRGTSKLCHFREKFNGKGELALSDLGIPFSVWAERLYEVSLSLITPKPEVVAAVRKIKCIKVIYTGSPYRLALRMLNKFGFHTADFDRIIGWQSPEEVPSKWGISTDVFQRILEDYDCQPNEAWSVGDNWEADLKPAHELGMKVAQIGKKNGNPAMLFPDILSFIEHISPQQKDD